MNEWMQDIRIKEIILDKKTLSRNIFNKNMLEKLLNIKNISEDPYDFAGKKIWMLEPKVPNWPWTNYGRTSPWYLSLEIFR